MLFRQLFDQSSCTYTYLLAQDYHCDALIIDPVLEHVPLYLKLIKELGLTLRYALDTHTHADHITASGTLQQTLCCDIVMGKQTHAAPVTRLVEEGDTIAIPGVTLTALYTPGHTDDCYSYVMHDRVFTGDALLIRGTGRTDFQSGNPYQAYEHITTKLLTLPDETLVYPAHNYDGMTVSTIWEEKQFNPRLQVDSAQAYADIMNHLNLPKPKLIDIAVPANLHCGLNPVQGADK